MKIENLVQYWNRPRSQEEESRWERLEYILNAKLLDDKERAAARRSQCTGKDIFDAGLCLIDGVYDWLHEIYEEQRRAPFFPGKGYFVQATAMFTLLAGLSLLGTLPILGAASAGYEAYRLFDRIVHKARRPTYYDTEAKKRFDKIAAQRSESHRIRHRTSVLYPPAPAELMEMWAKACRRGNVKDKLRFGTMMALVEAVVNNDLIRDETGEIVGRNPGVRGWLKVNCPELLSHYRSVMHYKAMADKEQAVCGLSDPYPSEVLFVEPSPMTENSGENTSSKENTLIEIMVGPKSFWGKKKTGKGAENADETADENADENVGENAGENAGEKGDGGRIEITVGPEFGDVCNMLVLRGVRQEARKWLRWNAGRVADVMLRARKSAASLHAETRKSGADSSLKRYEDVLFSRLGLVREIRIRPRRRSPQKDFVGS